MKVGQKLYSVFIDVEEDDDNNIIKTSCRITKYYVSSIQNRKIWRRSGEREKYIYIRYEDGELYRKKKAEDFDIKKDDYLSTTEAGAVRKALKSIPGEIKRFKSYRSDDPDYYDAYIDTYNGTIKRTLNRMIKSSEKREDKRKLLDAENKRREKQLKKRIKELQESGA